MPPCAPVSSSFPHPSCDCSVSSPFCVCVHIRVTFCAVLARGRFFPNPKFSIHNVTPETSTDTHYFLSPVVSKPSRPKLPPIFLVYLPLPTPTYPYLPPPAFFFSSAYLLHRYQRSRHRPTQIHFPFSACHPRRTSITHSPMPPLREVMLDQETSKDPTEERTGSSCFLPVASSLVRQLAEVSADERFSDSDAFSEPSDDEGERRYSDVSAHSVPESDHRSSPETAELIRQWNARVRGTDNTQDPPLVHRDRDRDVGPRAFAKNPSSTTRNLSSSNNRLWEDTLPTGHRTVQERTRSGATASGGTYEPHRFEFYGVGMENNPGFYSTPYFSLRQPPAKPEAIRPVVPPEPQKKKRSIWRFLSGRGRPKKDKKPRDALPSTNGHPRKEHIREKRDWKADSFRLLRRSGRVASSLEDQVTEDPIDSRNSRSQPVSADCQYRRSSGRPRSGARSSCSSVTTDACNNSSVAARTQFTESPSLGTLPHASRERHGSYADDKREPNSFAGYRGRIVFTTEGSSVSSSSDREEDGGSNGPESDHLYLSRRQLRAMQYK